MAALGSQSIASSYEQLLHVDNNSINTQYHNKIAHIPLNDDTTVIGGVYLKKSDESKVAAAAGSFTNSYEGLAGGTKIFNGTSDYLKFNSFDAISSEFSVPSFWGIKSSNNPGSIASLILKLLPGFPLSVILN